MHIHTAIVCTCTWHQGANDSSTLVHAGRLLREQLLPPSSYTEGYLPTLQALTEDDAVLRPKFSGASNLRARPTIALRDWCVGCVLRAACLRASVIA